MRSKASNYSWELPWYFLFWSTVSFAIAGPGNQSCKCMYYSNQCMLKARFQASICSPIWGWTTWQWRSDWLRWTQRIPLSRPIWNGFARMYGLQLSMTSCLSAPLLPKMFHHWFHLPQPVLSLLWGSMWWCSRSTWTCPMLIGIS